MITNGFDILQAKYVYIDDFEKNNVSYTIKVSKDCVDDKNIMDQGLILGIIDTYSSFAGFIQQKENILRISVSVALKLQSFSELYVNEEYKLFVYLKKEDDKFLYFQFKIMDKNNNLVKSGSHLKKITNARF